VKHDKDAIDRFYHAALNEKPIEPADAKAVALFINHAAQTIPAFRTLLTGAPRTRGPKYDMDRVTMDSRPFAIAFALERKHCTYPEAVEALCQHFDDIDERTAENYLAQLKPRAVAAVEFIAALNAATEE
jgi:hypothetical protein